MFPHPLDGAFYRVYRADEHLEDLRPRVAGFELEQREAVIASLQSNKWDQGCHIDISMPVGMSIAVRIGEILYNLRTALEYLVFEIAKLDSKSPQDFTKFPIVDCPKDFRSWKKQARRKGINASHIAIFQRYQPYKGCNWSLALRELSNMDKHREFPELGGSGTIKIITFSDDPDFADHSLPQISRTTSRQRREDEYEDRFPRADIFQEQRACHGDASRNQIWRY